MPLGARSSVVAVIKFSGAHQWTQCQKIAMLVIHKSAPSCCTRPRRWQRHSVAHIPSTMQRRSARHKNAAMMQTNATNVVQNESHVQHRERHIRRTNLNRQKIIPEPSLRARRQHEKTP